MNYYDLMKENLKRSSFIREFDGLINEKSGSHFYHLNRSLKSLLIVRAFMESGKNVLLVCSDDKLAEDYLSDLELLVGTERASFLPDYETLPYEERSPHYTVRAERIRSLSRVFSGGKGIWTLSLRSLLRKIVPPEIFSTYVIELKQMQEYSPDKLVSDLVGMGYDNVFQVSKVGEIARRGGIIDIFSPNMTNPVRIDYFGDEIESIRYFDVGSQRSAGNEIKKITIIPSREFSLHDIKGNDYFWDKIHTKGFYEGIEQDVSLLLSKTGGFLDYFAAEDLLIFWDEYQFFSADYQEMQEEVNELYIKARTLQKREHLVSPSNVFYSKSYVQRIFRNYQNFFISNGFQEFKRITYSLEMPAHSQKAFERGLEDLEKMLQNQLDEGYKIIIQSDNASQSKRMRDLLENLQGQVSFELGVFQKGFYFPEAGLAVYTDHEIFARYRRRSRQTRFSQKEALVDYESLKPGDYIVHIDYGVGVFKGLRQMPSGGSTIECLTIGYAENDTVYVPTFQLNRVSKFVGEEGVTPAIHKLGGKMWALAKKRAKKQIELIAEDLVKLYAERQVKKGIKFSADTSWQRDLEDAFIYEITPDQEISTREIKQDMESEKPMERLLCGDVGFGKTEVAIRAAFKAVMSGYQVAVLAPTTLLAEQHYHTFRERLAQYPVRIAMLSRFRSSAMLKKEVELLYSGELDIVIGTHRLLSKDVKFKKLGLLIVDEEHRFGVRHKDRLRQIKANVDTLYMSATPIPRTLSMALSKLKEMSLIRTSPKARLPIRTVVVPFDEAVIKDAINREIDRGGQVFFVHNRVQTIDSMADRLRKMLPHIRFAIGHGQLPEKQLEAVMLDFAEHKFDVLIASTIIESGIDIPNVNTMIINRADNFGLAQLYQIRGRVGRSNRRAYAYLIIPRRLTEIARKRLETLTEYESLGSGYQIAMRDLEIRGAGTMLGTKQSGTINSIGFNYYNRLLEKAVESYTRGSKDNSWQDDEPEENRDINVSDDFYIPHSYISSEKVRLEIYRRLISFKKEREFDELPFELEDRFGKLPQEVHNTLHIFRLRFLVDSTDLKKCQLRDKELLLEFAAERLPSKELIKKLLSEFSYPVRFETLHNLIIIFNLSKETENHYKIAFEILRRLAAFT